MKLNGPMPHREVSRTYHFSDGSKLTVDGAVSAHREDDGSTRLVTKVGTTVIVPRCWTTLRVKSFYFSGDTL